MLGIYDLSCISVLIQFFLTWTCPIMKPIDPKPISLPKCNDLSYLLFSYDWNIYSSCRIYAKVHIYTTPHINSFNSLIKHWYSNDKP